MLHKKEIDMVVNIPKNLTAGELSNGYKIRRAAIDLNIPLITNARLASAFINAFCTMSGQRLHQCLLHDVGGRPAHQVMGGV